MTALASSASAPSIATLGALKASGYVPRSVKTEIRENLIQHLRAGTTVFDGVHGYEDTVLPELERALLSEHHVLLLGLRGQAKTRLARLMVQLLDEWIPVVTGSELNDDPLQPLSRFAIDLIAEHGDGTPIAWLHRSARYVEKLATPDVSVADLIGDADPIKAANLKLPYSDERTIHYGLIPRAHRSIFVINELPDLQPRIQVALFNILQEGDIQIRGFKLRLPLDLQFVFTANPEDYTNRGSIVTPLKDRIDSQIITHYPHHIEVGKRITSQEARVKPALHEAVTVPDLALNLIEQVAIEARNSEFVDAKSGVSARLTISALENLYSAAERRMLLNLEKSTWVRISDFWGVMPSITGKIELVYEGEQEGAGLVAQKLIGKAIRTQFLQYFPDPEKLKRKRKDKEGNANRNPYQYIQDWFGEGNNLDLEHTVSDIQYAKALKAVQGLENLVLEYHPTASGPALLFLMEFALHGMAEYSLLSRNALVRGLQFKDLLSSMLGSDSENE